MQCFIRSSLIVPSFRFFILIAPMAFLILVGSSGSLERPLVDHVLRVQHYHRALVAGGFCLGWSHVVVNKLRTARIDYNTRHFGAGWALKVQGVGRCNSDPIFSAV
jgi:hypothetical protein